MNDLIVKKSNDFNLNLMDLIRIVTNLDEAQLEYLATTIEIMDNVNRIENKMHKQSAN